jgi:hypothetical protein
MSLTSEARRPWRSAHFAEVSSDGRLAIIPRFQVNFLRASASPCLRIPVVPRPPNACLSQHSRKVRKKMEIVARWKKTGR